MPTVVATVGSASANAFATVSECDTYCDARLNASAWNSETDDDNKARALIEATRELTVLGYVGVRVSDTQALAWPRQWAPRNDPSFSSSWYATTEIPQAVKDATCELALQFLAAGASDVASLETTTGIKQKTVDVLTTVYQDAWQRPTGLRRYPRVWHLVSPLVVQGSSNVVPTVRG